MSDQPAPQPKPRAPRKPTRNERYVVARGNVAYLKVVGKAPEWQLLTATASDSQPGFPACADQARLMAAALKIGDVIQTQPTLEHDAQRHQQVNICSIVDHLNNDAHFQQEIADLFMRFFELYDHEPSHLPGDAADAGSVYQVLACDGQDTQADYVDGHWLRHTGAAQPA
ncbi:hypothetical protein CCO03_04510 [Comamonas serinivorans]|uniref:Uncharacterized protein n=1 Tax=Comamonas serinivorans TaxID=1082851 RepID=A0A1Y0EK62_9BURK|nr:hypothetical protein [Comamonas serinivorans]ARU04034.1 hypothetical protein CCO03_04510 [Comamonas serinivorans]